MKINKLMIVASLGIGLMCSASVAAENIMFEAVSNLDKAPESPMNLQNRGVVEVAVVAAEKVSGSVTYAKEVSRNNNGYAFVDLVMEDKLCRVAVDESGDKNKAVSIACDRT